MKWFHHECTAKYEIGLQILGSRFGAAGIGVYWGLLEEMGHQSDLFLIKVTGLPGDEETNDPDEASADSPHPRVPEFPLHILARILFTSPEELQTVIDTCARIGLFDRSAWRTSHIICSPWLEKSADDYTRRVRKQSESSRPLFEESPTQTPARAEVSSPRTEKNRDRTEQTNGSRTGARGMLSTGSARQDAERGLYVNQGELADYLDVVQAKMVQWQKAHELDVGWVPTREELGKLMNGGDPHQKLLLCIQASEALQRTVRFPELVMRAIALMLKTSLKTEIRNPFGWVWACLHASDGGGAVWEELLREDGGLG